MIPIQTQCTIFLAGIPQKIPTRSKEQMAQVPMYWFIGAHSLTYLFNCCVISFDSKAQVIHPRILQHQSVFSQPNCQKKTKAEHRKCWGKQRNPSLAANPKLRRFEWHGPWPLVGFCGVGRVFLKVYQVCACPKAKFGGRFCWYTWISQKHMHKIHPFPVSVKQCCILRFNLLGFYNPVYSSYQKRYLFVVGRLRDRS